MSSAAPASAAARPAPPTRPPPRARFGIVRSADKTKLVVNWTPGHPRPGCGSGDRLQRRGDRAGRDGRWSPKHRRRRTGASATSVTLPSTRRWPTTSSKCARRPARRSSEPFSPANTTPPPPPGDTTVPKLTLSPAPASDGSAVEATEVKLSSETGADLYYTADGSSVLTGDLPSDTAKL